MKRTIAWLVSSSIVIILLMVSCSPVVDKEDVTEEITIPTTTVDVSKDIEYGRVGDTPLLLDIYIPETSITTPMPAVICKLGGEIIRAHRTLLFD